MRMGLSFPKSGSLLEQNAGKQPRTVCPIDKTRNVKAEAWRDRDGVTEDIVGEFVSVEGQG